MNDYKDEKGLVNWTAYRQAQIANGEICSRCRGYVGYSYNRQPFRTECSECKELRGTDEIYTNEKGIRCPNCRHIIDPTHDCDMDVYKDGTHTVTCDGCEHEFEVTTTVTYSWSSPQVIDHSSYDEPEDEDEDE